MEYNIDGVLIKKIDKKSEIHYSAELPYKIYHSYKKNNLVIEEYFERENIYKSTLQKNNVKILRKKHLGKTLEKKIYVDDCLVKHTKYYTNTNSIISTQIYKNYYTEYFTNKKLRAEGYLINDKPNG